MKHENTPRLAPRFYAPMTLPLLAELRQYQDIIDAEVTRVANVCNYFEKEVYGKGHGQPARASVGNIRHLHAGNGYREVRFHYGWRAPA